jgi:hypothetical protein
MLTGTNSTLHQIADVMCNVSQHQATQQTLTASQPVICSSTSVSPLVERFGQHSGPQTGSGQGNEILPPGFGFLPITNLHMFNLKLNWYSVVC